MTLRRLEFVGLIAALAVLAIIGSNWDARASSPPGQSCVSETTGVVPAGQINEVVCAWGMSIKVRLVDFKGAPEDPPGNYEIHRDREGADPEHITDRDGAAREWHDLQPYWPNGITELNWPVAYEKGSAVVIKQAWFRVKIWGIDSDVVTIRGTAPVPGGPGGCCGGVLVFEQTVPLTQPEVVINNVTSQGTLPDYVMFLEPMTIEWEAITGEWRWDAGESNHMVYTTLNPPADIAADAGAGDEDESIVYFTLIDLSTHGAFGASDESDTVAGSWEDFDDPDPKPEVRRREFDPVSGAVNHNGTAMTYWGPNAVGCDLNNTAFLLKNADGRCSAWAHAFKHTLGIHGIASGIIVVECNEAAPGMAGCSGLLVNKWDFPAAEDFPGTDFPYKWSNVKNLDGAPAQSIDNPTSDFNLHFIVTYGGRVYDPSYGTDYNSKALWETDSLAGFIDDSTPSRAKKNPVGDQTTP